MARLEGLWKITTADGEVLELHGVVTRMAGYGMAPASYVGQRTPTQHGSSHLAFRLEDRELMIGLLWHGKWQSCLHGKRTDLRKVFSYLAGPLTIQRALPDQTVNELRRCWFAGGLEGDSEATWDDTEVGAVRLLCRDPAWYNTAIRSTASTSWTIVAGLYYSVAIVDSGDGLVTAGDWYAYPTFTLAGPMTSFQVESVTTGQLLRFYGPILDGESVTLICNPNPGPSAIHSDGNDVQNYIPPSDDFGGFCLWPSPLAADGANEWTITIGGIGANTLITVEWEDRDQGV